MGRERGKFRLLVDLSTLRIDLFTLRINLFRLRIDFAPLSPFVLGGMDMKIYKKILAWVNAVIDDIVGADGLKHIVVSAVMTALLALVMPAHLAGLIVLALGVVKELVDGHTDGKREVKDLVCNIIGILIVVI